MADRTLAIILDGKDKTSGAFRSVAQEMGGVEGSAHKMAAGVAAASVVAVAALVSIGKAAFELGASFDAAYDTLRIKTGQTGAELEGLKDSFRTVFTSIPIESGEGLAGALATIHQRTGQTGASLEQLGIQVMNLSRITGTDAVENARLVTRAYGDWSVATEDQAGALDKVFRASQAADVPIAQLLERVVAYGAPLRQFGFGFEQALAMLAKFEKEGVNTELVMGSLRQAIGVMARAGVDLEDGLQTAIQVISELESQSEATGLAMAVFGAEAGPDMAAAIREGRFELGEMLTAVSDGEESINEAATSTMDASERWQLALQNTAVAFEPVGDAAFNLAAQILEDLEPNIKWLAEVALPGLGSALETVGGVFGVVGGNIDAFIGRVATATGAVMQFIALVQSMPTFGGSGPAEAPDRMGAAAASAAGLQLGGDRLRGLDMSALGYAPAAVTEQVAGGVESGTAAATPRVRAAGGASARDWISGLRNGLNGGGGGAGGGGGGGGVKAAVRTALDGFDEAAAEAVRDRQFAEAFGKVGADAAVSLITALTNNTDSAGQQVVSAVEKVRDDLRTAEVPNWRELGDELMDSARVALLAKTDETKDQFLAKLSELTSAARAIGALSPAAFGVALQRADLEASRGSDGASLMRNLEVAIREGGRKNIDAVADVVSGMRIKLIEDLDPETAARWAGGLMDAVTTAIDEKSPEANAALSGFLQSLRFDLPLEQAGLQLANTINQAIDEADAAIKGAQRNAADQIADLFEQQSLARDERGQRDSLSAEHKIRMDNLNTELDADRAAAAERIELRDIAERRALQMAETRRRNQPQGVEVPGGNRRSESPIDDLKAQWRAEDAERAKRKADAEQSAAEEIVRRGRIETESNRQTAERTLLDDALADAARDRQIARIFQERDTAIQSANDRLAEIERQETDKFAREEEKLTAIRALADGVFDGMLADLDAVLEKTATVSGGSWGGVGQYANPANSYEPAPEPYDPLDNQFQNTRGDEGPGGADLAVQVAELVTAIRDLLQRPQVFQLNGRTLATGVREELLSLRASGVDLGLS